MKLIRVDNSRKSALKWTSVQFYLKHLGKRKSYAMILDLNLLYSLLSQKS